MKTFIGQRIAEIIIQKKTNWKQNLSSVLNQQKIYS